MDIVLYCLSETKCLSSISRNDRKTKKAKFFLFFLTWVTCKRWRFFVVTLTCGAKYVKFRYSCLAGQNRNHHYSMQCSRNIIVNFLKIFQYFWHVPSLLSLKYWTERESSKFSKITSERIEFLLNIYSLKIRTLTFSKTSL